MKAVLNPVHREKSVLGFDQRVAVLIYHQQRVHTHYQQTILHNAQTSHQFAWKISVLAHIEVPIQAQGIAYLSPMLSNYQIIRD